MGLLSSRSRLSSVRSSRSSLHQLQLSIRAGFWSQPNLDQCSVESAHAQSSLDSGYCKDLFLAFENYAILEQYVRTSVHLFVHHPGSCLWALVVWSGHKLSGRGWKVFVKIQATTHAYSCGHCICNFFDTFVSLVSCIWFTFMNPVSIGHLIDL